MHRRAAALVLLSAALGLMAGCRRTPEAATALEITRQRWNVDEKAGVVRVVGEIANRGQTPVVGVEVKALLRGASGEARGENLSEVLRDLRPGEKRQFAVDIRSHGGVSSVELTPQVPTRK